MIAASYSICYAFEKHS